MLLLISSICLVTVYHQVLSQPPPLNMSCEEQQAAIRNANAQGILQWKPSCAVSRRTVRGKNARGFNPQQQTRGYTPPPPNNRLIPFKPGQAQRPTLPVQLPESYNTTYTYRSKCPSVDHILNQGQCGNCWAASTISMVNDRMCIYGQDGVQQKYYSWKELTQCVPNGCKGVTDLALPLRYWNNSGLTTGGVSDWQEAPGCQPWPQGGVPLSTTGTECPASCADGNSIVTKAYGSQAYKLPADETAIMTEIYLYGPVIGAFFFYQDFDEYSSGVYKKSYGAQDGGHAIKIVGWGVENGVNYWLIQNSWGTMRGEKGFFKFERGENGVGLESMVYAAVPREAIVSKK